MTEQTPAHQPASPRQRSLRSAILELEEHVAQRGWDAPARVFALVRTAAALEQDPALAELLDDAALAQARHDPQALTMIEQENLPAAVDLEDLLGRLAWPQTVDGVALAVERLVLPAEAEQEAAAIQDAQERLAFLRAQPDREDVRMVVGVLRTGESWCAVRSRTQDSADRVVSGDTLVPGLVEALASTLE
ncbi:PPA1309 family protein [Actinomyces israelii]|uniref:PPA1309 family protein n=1 Tax=Actinomyces israelii TaxID=1659 RepID=UPI0025572D31|nr:PPA1309 family protein [Actinomyces israelii]WKR21417.1 hypothetical protein AIF0345_1327 [Actinomyces israelii]